jgi:hypothetical protein
MDVGSPTAARWAIRAMNKGVKDSKAVASKGKQGMCKGEALGSRRTRP